MQPTAGSALNLREVVRALRHLVDWVDYHSRGDTQPSRCPARLTFYASSGRARYSVGQTAKDEAA
jgi:hypothetical protein